MARDPQPPTTDRRTRFHPDAAVSGALLAAAATPLAVARTLHGDAGAPLWPSIVGAASSALLLLAALVLARRPKAGRFAAAAGLVGFGGLAGPAIVVSPFATLAALVIGATLLRRGLRSADGRRPQDTHPWVRGPAFYEAQARAAAGAALGLWLLWVMVRIDGAPVDPLGVVWAFALAIGLAGEWAIRHRRRDRPRAIANFVLAAMAAALAARLWGSWWWLTSGLAAVVLGQLAATRDPRDALYRESRWEPLLGHPERLFIGTFAGLCLAGTVLLALPQSAADGRSLDLADAAFTATSAVCVTGLIVLDTPVDFSRFGQAVILLLIQIGGLGIMTFSTAALFFLGRRMSLRHEGAVASLIATQDRGRLFTTARQILLLTLAVEAAGALLLSALFISRGEALAPALWRGVFTAVSAFCNAGFALDSASLVPYQDSPILLHTVGVLIVLGGLSPVAVFALPAIIRRTAAPVSAQARLSLAATAALLLSGLLFFLAFEWNGALAGLSPADRLHNAWFQSVTLRTAGFNSVDLGGLQPATLTLMLIWMYIGGNPGGTAGGIKTTTAAILFLSVVQAIRGRWTLEAFGRRISERSRTKAAVIVAISLLTGVLSLVAIQLTQTMDTRLAVFEVVSALGTVGLSIGGTAELDDLGKAILIVCMFVGRVGGLTLLMFLSHRNVPPAVGRPEEDIAVG